jgi:chloramphenicol 3-O phosphotransferase
MYPSSRVATVYLVTLDDNRLGRVVVLNGGSSAGKTTVGRKLQSSLDGPWLLLGVDLLLWMLPMELVSNPSGISVHDGVITRGGRFMQIYAGFQQAVAALARSGVDVLIDDVLLGGGADQRRWDDALRDLDVCWVGVRCAPDIAAAREAVRGDRPAGIAREQANAVHDGVRYDLEVDAGVLDVPQSVELIAEVLRRMWSVQNTPVSDEPPTLPTVSAWTSRGSIRLPPWEG